MIKRIISTLICLSLIFASVSVSADVSDGDIGVFLEKIGIVQQSANDNDEIVTRGEFANISVKLINLPETTPTNSANAFVDVSKDSEYYTSVEILRNLGFISGTGSALFEPESAITVEAAAKIIVHIMGYEQYVTNNDYIVVANRKKIFNGVISNADGSLNRENVNRIIYNTLEANVSDSNTVDGKTYGSKGDVFMSKRLNIYKAEGVVEDDGSESISLSSNISTDKIQIGGIVYDDMTGTDNILGRYVTVYYKQDINSGRKTAIYIQTAEENDDILTITANDIIDFENYTYTYSPEYDKTREKKAKITPTYRLVYNGRLYSADKASKNFSKTLDEILKPTTGTVTLIDSDLNGSYDTVYIKSYENILVEAVDSTKFIICGDADATSGNIELKEASDSLTVLSARGTVVPFTNICNDDVVSVAVSADGSHAEIRIIQSTVEGIIEAEENEKYILAEDEYYFTDEYKAYKETHKNDKSFAGKKAKLYLSFDGGVVYAKALDSDGLIYARLLSLDLEKDLKAKLYMQTNSVSEYVISDKVKIDGKKIGSQKLKNKQAAKAYLENGFTYDGEFYGLVLVKINQNNEITYIDTPYKESVGNPNADTESPDTLHMLRYGEPNVRNCGYMQHSFLGDFVVTGDCVYYSVGTASEEPEKDTIFTEFDDVTNVQTIRDWRLTAAFSTVADSSIATLIMKISSNTMGSITDRENKRWLVVKTFKCLDVNGDRTIGMTVTNGMDVKDYIAASETAFTCKCGGTYCEEHPIEIEKGDIVKLFVDRNGYIPDNGVFVCYDRSEKAIWDFGGKVDKHNWRSDGIPGAAHTNTAMDYFSSSYYSTISGTFLSGSRIAADWEIDYWPYLLNTTFEGTNYVGIYGENIKRTFELVKAYVVEMDTDKGKFEYLSTTDLTPGSQAVILSYVGEPYLIVRYKD